MSIRKQATLLLLGSLITTALLLAQAPRLTPTAAPPMASTVSEVPVPMVTVRVRAPSEVREEQNLVYRILVENRSKATANHVTLKITIPVEEATLVRASDEPVDMPVNQYVWKFGTMKPCSKEEIVLTMKPTGSRDVSCCARVTFEHGQCVKTAIRGASAGPKIAGEKAPRKLPELKPTPLTPTPEKKPRSRTPPLEFPEPDTVIATPSKAGGLSIRLTGKKEAQVNDIIEYKIDFRNATSKTLKNIIVTSTLPEGMAVQNCKPNNVSDKPAVWKFAELAPGATRTIVCNVIVEKAGKFTIPVTVEAGDLRANSNQELRVGEAGLAIIKTGPKNRVVGRKATYHITISNPGNATATNVRVSDELPKELSYIRSTDKGTLEGRFVVWEFDKLAPKEQRTLKVTLDTDKIGLFANVATVSADRLADQRARTETGFDVAPGVFCEIEKNEDPIIEGKETEVLLRFAEAKKLAVKDVQFQVRLSPEVKFLGMRVTGTGKVDPVELVANKEGTTFKTRPFSFKAGEEPGIFLRLRGESAGIADLEVKRVGDSDPFIAKETLTIREKD